MLHAARNRLPTPWLARILLGLGVGATIAANVGYGRPFGWLSAVMSAWPAVAFVGSAELAIWVVRNARRNAGAAAGTATGRTTDDATGTDGSGDSDRDTDHDSGNGDERQHGGKGSDMKPPPGRQRQRQRAPSGSGKARDILQRNPRLPKAEVARRAGVSVRTVERVIGQTSRSAA